MLAPACKTFFRASNANVSHDIPGRAACILERSNAMGLYEILDQVVDLLRRRGRVTYRALKREFQVDDAFLEDLKAELITAQRLAVDEQDTVLVWVGEAGTPPAPQEDARSPQGEPRSDEHRYPEAE